MYGIIWSPTPFPISVKKTSSSSSYFTSPSFVFTFILFYPSIVRFFFWRLCVSMNKINFRYSISIYLYSTNITRYTISFNFNIFSKSKLKCKSHMSIVFVYMTWVNMSRAWNTPTHFINNFLIRVVENGFCLFCNSHKRNKMKMKIEKAQKE